MTEAKTFALGDFVLQGGMTLRGAQLSYTTYGTLSPDRDNVILYPTSYSAQHHDIEWLIGPGRVLDPSRWFIVIPNQFANGLSTSPSNVGGAYDRGRWPDVTYLDNIRAQHRLLTEGLGIDRLAMVYGWSMGGQQAYHWGALYPEMVERLCILCGSARTAPHNQVFIQGVRATLTADAAFRDGWFHETPVRGLRAMGRVYAGWALSQTFYREELWRGIGFASVEDFVVSGWEGNFLRRNANDLLAQLWTWEHGDISANDRYRGDLRRALGSIRAKTLLMPGDADLYFQVADNAREVPHIPFARLKPIPSAWGHRAGNPAQNPEDERFIAKAVAELLAT
ncbi:homoserine O-acetyltransferase [Stella humosa]|uniref:Homoserine O-acetyltransferase n=1 Tax=Stella humosa TaxID=94 RepID=A0A3N1MGQ3_9PROT|nr:alpha/beta fold hydrolase [Stella humosa]ROQ01810.1 homoserine O-acetyltransferase [Stella humosa]BBK32197.1 homoserine O-acetyltransferase [Stella humosa]